MIDEEKIFGNLFDTDRVTTPRLLNFAKDHREALVTNNGANEYDALIALLDPLIAALDTELGDVDVALVNQILKTRSVDELIKLFRTTMSEKQGVIADALGGFQSDGFLQFYPHGQKEYTVTNKTTMPVLSHRVNMAATDNAGSLPAPLVAVLQAFEGQFDTLRAAQSAQKDSVDVNRTERNAAEVNLELGLLTSLHTIAAKFPADVERCLDFFDFQILFFHGHRESDDFSGTLQPGEIRLLMNRAWTSSTEASAKVTSPSGKYIIYRSTANNLPPEPGIGLEIKPSRSKKYKPEILSTEDYNFLLLQNPTENEPVDYYVKVVG